MIPESYESIGVELIKAVASDRDYLLDLRLNTMAAHLEEAGVVLSHQEHMDRVEHEYQHSYLIEVGGQRVGLLKYKKDPKTVQVIQLQISPEFQRKGYGRRVMEHVMAQSKGKTMTLSVLKKNPALGLYRRLGFIQSGEDSLEYHLEKAL